jgi:cadmium resistance protein CadD (predicted permease)
MVDNFFAFAAQVVLTPVARHRRISLAHFTGVTVLVAGSALIGALLADFPAVWLSILALAPFGLGIHAWRHRHDPTKDVYKRGAVTTVLVTVALGGDNVAVWSALLRLGGVLRAVITVVVFAIWEVIFLAGATAVARHPKMVEWGTARAPLMMPPLYFALALVIVAGAFGAPV